MKTKTELRYIVRYALLKGLSPDDLCDHSINAVRCEQCGFRWVALIAPDCHKTKFSCPRCQADARIDIIID